jgi:hypothetical protein
LANLRKRGFYRNVNLIVDPFGRAIQQFGRIYFII